MYLYKLEKISEHIIILQRLQLPDSHWANLCIWVVAVKQLHGQANIQTTAKQCYGERWYDIDPKHSTVAVWNALVPGVPCAAALQQSMRRQNIFLFPPSDWAQQLWVGSKGKAFVIKLYFQYFGAKHYFIVVLI